MNENEPTYDKSRYSRDHYRELRREREMAQRPHDERVLAERRAAAAESAHAQRGAQDAAQPARGDAAPYGRQQAPQANGTADPFAPSSVPPQAPVDGTALWEPAAAEAAAAAAVGEAGGSSAGGGGSGTRRKVLRGGSGGKRKPLRIALAAVAALLLVLVVGWYALVSFNMAPSEDVSAVTSSPGFGKPYYVLLLGSDSRAEEDDVARADSIILARVDEGAKKVTLVSMPRDLRVEIPGHGMGKLNSALTYGGFSGAIDAVSREAGVPISYYAVIYFSGFKKLVNKLGGVKVDVPEGTYYNGTWVPAGKNVKINGKQALVLARCRHGNPPDQGAYAAGDFQRTLNQRNLMRAIVKKTLKRSPLEMPGTILTVSECVETNMPAYKLAWLALAMRGMNTKTDMYTAVVPSSGQYIDGVSYVVADEAAWQEMMQRVEAGEDPNG